MISSLYEVFQFGSNQQFPIVHKNSNLKYFKKPTKNVSKILE